MNLTFEQLRYANVQRNKEWDPDNIAIGSFRGLELAGEVGELCNVVKKLERERLGWKGSKATILQLAEELADAQITLDLLAMHYNIDLGEATFLKFNATSGKLGWKTKIGCGDPSCRDASCQYGDADPYDADDYGVGKD